MSSVTLSGESELYYQDDWLGPPWLKPEPALLIHGAGESSAAWFGWVPRMAQRFRVLRPDLPGFGRSAVRDDFEWSVANLAAVVDQLLGRLGIESAHIIGAKLGGAIAMQFAAAYPKQQLVERNSASAPRQRRISGTDRVLGYADGVRGSSGSARHSEGGVRAQSDPRFVQNSQSYSRNYH